MSIKTIVKILLVCALVYTGVQFAVVWVNYAQMNNILDTEALEARRHRHSEKVIIQNVVSHMNRTATNLPIQYDIGVSGVEDRSEPIEIEMDYTEVVDLHLFKVPIKLTATGIAEPPIK